MNANSSSPSQAVPNIPPDDPRRNLTIVRPATDRNLAHLVIAGGTYTILLTGDDTAGRYCLTEMLVPPGGGPPPHRHDFEEMFTVLVGEIELTFRGETKVARAGDTVNIPSNAPHSFRNSSDAPAQLLCMCAPAGQELFFMEIGDPVASRMASPPILSETEKVARKKKVEELAPRYRTELLNP